MKPEVSERLFIEELFQNSKEKLDNNGLALTTIERLTGDASTRRYYRLFTNKEDYVACLDNPSVDEENQFVAVQDFLDKHNVRVPKIYDKNLKKGYILEEDLGDITLLQHVSSIGDKEKLKSIYTEILDHLLSIHQIPAMDIEACPNLNLKFDYDKLISEIEFTVKFFVEKLMGIEDDKISRNIINFFSPICKRLASEKMVLTHRDFHSRNIMVKDDEYIVIDFQDARWGIPQYDLASMLEDCYFDLPVSTKEELIKYYYDSMGEKALEQGSFENFMCLYRDMTLQRVFKAVGSFAYIHATRGDIRYLKYIGFAMEKLRNVMLEDSRYDDLRKQIFSIYYQS